MLLKISKENHKNFRLPKFTIGNKIDGTVTFLGDFSYKIEKQYDTNKVIGLSDSWNHLRDSVRIGWRWYKNELQVMSLIHSQGEIQISYLTTVRENKEYSFSISIEKNSYIIVFDSKKFEFERKSRWKFLRYYLFTYFGGKTKAPKDFKFKINCY
jgi:hypothetical protein